MTNYHGRDYCYFCNKDSKKEFGGATVCVNGHYLIKCDEIEELQPRSIGTRISSHRVYRLDSTFGKLCDKDGKVE